MNKQYAFPGAHPEHPSPQDGLTKAEYFAGCALTALAAHYQADLCAQVAYEYGVALAEKFKEDQAEP